MATGLHSDFVIRPEFFDTVFVERLNQNVNVFNEGSRGAIRLIPMNMEGYYNKLRFMDRLTGGSSRRDLTSNSGLTDTALTQDEVIGVKRFKKFGPYSQTLGSIKTAGMTNDDINAALATMFADEVSKDYVNSAATALTAFLGAESGLDLDYSGTGDLDHTALIQGLAKLGDAANRIVCWFGHSKPFFDLMESSLTVGSGNVSPQVIFEGNIGTVNRPYVMSDSSDLIISGTPDNYVTLGLQEGACTITESEDREFVADVITGEEQLKIRYQGEYAYNIEVKGAQWDTTNGGTNPTDATLGTSTNWDAVVASDKDKAGVHIQTT